MTIPALYELFRKHPFVTTDSRNCPPDSLFFALRGDRFDGNDYIEQALANGVAYAVGDRKTLPANDRIIQVEDALVALQQLANHHRKQLATRVIAITGTNGKTTTKELVAAVLSSAYTILYTEGNLNNHIGVPLTLLRLKPEHRLAIVEMGANHPGEIRALCEIAEPDFGLITNVGKAHLEGFGSFEGVIKTKTELYDYLRKKGGTVFVNQDNELLRSFLNGLSVITYGTSPDSFVRGKITASSPTLGLSWEKDGAAHTTTTHLVGEYNLENVLAATCIGSYFEVPAGKIVQAIESYVPTNNRSQHVNTGKNQLIVDAYNANPSSMQASLNNFFAMNASPDMVILGEMWELGDYSREEHQKVLSLLQTHPPEKVILIGNAFRELPGLPESYLVFETTEQTRDYLKEQPLAGYTILIKGSRGNKLETLVAYL